jgi:hypothetical protein
MDVVLVILGVLGFGAIVIAAYVFTVAARNYVSEDDLSGDRPPGRETTDRFVQRQPGDRRRGIPVTFPITVKGVRIARDRRVRPDRRRAA